MTLILFNRSDWKRHKKADCNTSKLPKGTESPALPRAPQEIAGGKVRNTIIPTPTNASCACWCCGMLIPAFTYADSALERLSGKEKAQFIKLDRQYTSAYGRDIGAMKPQRGVSCPATSVLGEIMSTGGYGIGCSEDGMLTCIFCYKALTHKNSKNAEKHIKKCEDYLYSENLAALKAIGQLSLVEKRSIAMATIELDPDLSNGSLSTAGHMKKQGKKDMALTYEYQNLESLAFPTLLGEAKGFQGGSLDDLRHYTLMRLYSADDSWRNDPDYVCFSLLRLAAYGCERAKMFVSRLPAPSSFRDGFNDVIEIRFLHEYFHR